MIRPVAVALAVLLSASPVVALARGGGLSVTGQLREGVRRCGGLTREVAQAPRSSTNSKVASPRPATYQADLGGAQGQQVTVRFSGMNRRRLPAGGYEVRMMGAVVRGPLNAWIEDLSRSGRRAYRTVTIRRIDGMGTTTERWTLDQARVAVPGGGGGGRSPEPLNARSNDVQMEEIVLACERMDPP